MIPIIPKTSVSPLAIRKIRSPYCRPFRIWTKTSPMALRRAWRKIMAGASGPARHDRLRRQLAAGGRVGEVGGDCFHQHVLATLELAQIEVLDRIVRGGEAERPARALERRLLHGRVQGILLGHI